VRRRYSAKKAAWDLPPACAKAPKMQHNGAAGREARAPRLVGTTERLREAGPRFFGGRAALLGLQ
jgi:hypothetical protein